MNRQEGCYQDKAVVQGCRARIQDSRRGHQRNLHRCAYFIPCMVTRLTGIYPDKKCPFTGDVSIRGRILTGRVVSTKMTRTIIIRRDYLHYIPKYSEADGDLLRRQG